MFDEAWPHLDSRVVLHPLPWGGQVLGPAFAFWATCVASTGSYGDVTSLQLGKGLMAFAFNG